MSEPLSHPLTISSHGPVPGALHLGPVHEGEHFSVNVMLRRRPDGPPLPSPEALGAQAPRLRRYLTHEEFELKHGADPADADAIRAFADAYGLDVTQVSLARRTVTLAGTAGQFAKAFATTLHHFAYAGGTYRAHNGPLHLPVELLSVVTAVIGLDERPVALPQARVRPPHWDARQLALSQAAAAGAASQYAQRQVRALNEKYARGVQAAPALADLFREYQRWAQLAADPATPPRAPLRTWLEGVLPQAAKSHDALAQLTAGYGAELRGIWGEAARLAALAALDQLDVKTPNGVAELYNFPEDADGAGQCVGIIELGGGYRREDLVSYFAFCGLPMPDISDVSVAGGANLPGAYEPYDGEVCLDVEVVGGAAPGARMVCYFAPLTAQGFIEAVHTAVHDRVNSPSVISASWDLSEAFWLETPMYLEAFEEVLKEAALLGVTVCCSAGDYGSSSEFLDGRAWVDYPASSPYVLGCGGTTLYSRGGQIIWEIVWNTARTFFQATGGGVSQIFKLPAWQDSADVPESVNPGGGKGRGVPDVAANADPTTGYLVQVDGRSAVICGTSSGAPLWAALIARINQSLGVRVGYINPYLYNSVDQAEALRDVLVYGNGVYSARKGWDACTGWGTPNGAKLRDALGAEGADAGGGVHV